MAETKIVGYKKVFGFVLPDWVSETIIRNVIVGVLTTAVMFLVLIFVIWPDFALVTAKEAELKSSQDSLEVLRSSKAGLDKIKIDITEDEQRRILAAMPQQYSPDTAIFALRKISADTGVSIVSYSLPSGVLLDTTGPTNGGADGEMVSFVAFPIQMTVAAPVESLLKFISAIESSLPYGVVSDLNLQEVTKLSRTANDKTVQLALEIRFYQAVLRRVNINKLEAFTEEDLVLAKKLDEFNLLAVPGTDQTSVNISQSTGSGNLFGF